MVNKLAGAAKSKTVWFGAALTGLGALQASMYMLTDFLTARQLGLATVVVGLLVIVLRAITTEPLVEKTEEGKRNADAVVRRKVLKEDAENVRGTAREPL